MIARLQNSAMALIETNSNEEPLAGAEQVYNHSLWPRVSCMTRISDLCIASNAIATKQWLEHQIRQPLGDPLTPSPTSANYHAARCRS